MANVLSNASATTRSKNAPDFINIGGRDYVSGKIYMLDTGYYESTLQQARSAGLPHEKRDGLCYYNNEDCQKWHMGG